MKLKTFKKLLNFYDKQNICILFVIFKETPIIYKKCYFS